MPSLWPSQQMISPEFADVLDVSKLVWQQSAGAFDPRLGPWWTSGALALCPDDVVPADDQIAQALALQVTSTYAYDMQMISKSALCALILSAVAKGYAVDQVADLLEMLALPDYLVEVGGEMRLGGFNPQRAALAHCG